MTKDEIIEFIKNNLKVDIEIKPTYEYNGNLIDVRVTTSLGDEVIHDSSDSVSID